MARKRLDSVHHVVRTLKARLVHDEDGEITVFPGAFRLRLKGEGGPPPRVEDEKYISSVWYEYFTCDEAARVQESKAALELSWKLKPKDALGIFNVGEIEKCGEEVGVKLEAWHQPTKRNAAYAAVRGMRPEHQENDLLPALITAKALKAVYFNKDI